MTAKGQIADHGTTSRWRYGCRCDACRRAHTDDQISARDAAAMERWRTLGPRLCRLIERGHPYRAALAMAGVTAQAVTAQRRRDPVFAARLDTALLAGRDDDVTHGSATGWRGGCRCPECREHHEQTR